MAKTVSGFPDFSKDRKAGKAFATAMSKMDEDTYKMALAARKAAAEKSKKTTTTKAKKG